MLLRSGRARAGCAYARLGVSAFNETNPWYQTMPETFMEKEPLKAKGLVWLFQHALSAVGQPPG